MGLLREFTERSSAGGATSLARILPFGISPISRFWDANRVADSSLVPERWVRMDQQRGFMSGRRTDGRGHPRAAQAEGVMR